MRQTSRFDSSIALKDTKSEKKKKLDVSIIYGY